MSKHILFLLVILFLAPQSGRADNMATLLKSCAYGTLAGAAVGLASLAITDNPGGKINNVARGASLGLYVGAGMGIYLVNAPEKVNSDYVQANLWFTPVTHRNQIDGAQLNWARFSF